MDFTYRRPLRRAKAEGNNGDGNVDLIEKDIYYYDYDNDESEDTEDLIEEDTYYYFDEEGTEKPEDVDIVVSTSEDDEDDIVEKDYYYYAEDGTDNGESDAKESIGDFGGIEEVIEEEDDEDDEEYYYYSKEEDSDSENNVPDIGSRPVENEDVPLDNESEDNNVDDNYGTGEVIEEEDDEEDEEYYYYYSKEGDSDPDNNVPDTGSNSVGNEDTLLDIDDSKDDSTESDGEKVWECPGLLMEAKKTYNQDIKFTFAAEVKETLMESFIDKVNSELLPHLAKSTLACQQFSDRTQAVRSASESGIFLVRFRENETIAKISSCSHHSSFYTCSIFSGTVQLVSDSEFSARRRIQAAKSIENYVEDIQMGSSNEPGVFYTEYLGPNYPNSIRSEGNDFSDNFAIAVSVIFLISYLLFLAKRHRSEKSKGRFNVLVNEQES